MQDLIMDNIIRNGPDGVSYKNGDAGAYHTKKIGQHQR